MALESNLKNLQLLLSTMDADHLSKGDFMEAFDEVLRVVKSAKDVNAKEFDAIHKYLTDFQDKLSTDTSSAMDTTKQEVMYSHATAVQKLTSDTAAALEQIKQAIPKDGINGIDGIPGPKGLDGSPDTGDQIIEKINGASTLISPTAIKDFETEVKKQTLSTGARAGWGAHPLQIQGTGTTKTKVARVINFTGATVSQSRDGVTTVAVSASGANPQTPSGAVNGSNVTFTVSGSITALFVNGQFMTPGGVDYTLSGTTITMITAPPTNSVIYAF